MEAFARAYYSYLASHFTHNLRGISLTMLRWSERHVKEAETGHTILASLFTHTSRRA